MWARENRDVAGLVFIKASGSLVWGASDVLYVRSVSDSYFDDTHLRPSAMRAAKDVARIYG